MNFIVRIFLQGIACLSRSKLAQSEHSLKFLTYCKNNNLTPNIFSLENPLHEISTGHTNIVNNILTQASKNMLQTTIIEMKNKMEEKLVAYKIARKALLNHYYTKWVA